MNTSTLITICGLLLPSLSWAESGRDFQITLENDPAGSRVMRWPSIPGPTPGRTYEIEESDSLGSWTPVGGTEFVADQNVSRRPMPELAPPRFLRVVAQRE